MAYAPRTRTAFYSKSQPARVIQRRGADVRRLDTIFGYTFENPSLLHQALRDKSVRKNTNGDLEFDGDKTLGWCVSRMVKAAYNSTPTTTYQRKLMNDALASNACLIKVGIDHNVHHLVQRNGTEKLDDNPKIIANAVEAAIEAVYEDGGIEAAQTVVNRLLQPELARLEAMSRADPHLKHMIKTHGMYPSPYDAKTGLKLMAAATGVRHYASVSHGKGARMARASLTPKRGGQVVSAHVPVPHYARDARPYKWQAERQVLANIALPDVRAAALNLPPASAALLVASREKLDATLDTAPLRHFTPRPVNAEADVRAVNTLIAHVSNARHGQPVQVPVDKPLPAPELSATERA
ncbi:MAG: hypothetical protein WAX89_01830 [Alphaproteobacteria bacterium]